MSKRTKIILLICFLIILLTGIGLMLYPMISASYANTHRSEYFMEYKTEVEKVDTTEKDAAWVNAQEHNRKLYAGELNALDPKVNGYFDQLNLMAHGVMGYITIPSIDVTLPIFHGTSEDVLRAGAGHMPESSLPIGGDNTHSVITAHSGMASEPMFSDLGLLEVGDIFQLNILGRILTYEVYEIPEPVLPQYVDVIQIQGGKDLCTLITCTPFGINTHRLLIHAERIENPVEETQSAIQKSKKKNDTSVWQSNYQRSLIIGISIAAGVILLIFLIFVIRFFMVPKKPGKYEYRKDNDKKKRS